MLGELLVQAVDFLHQLGRFLHLRYSGGRLVVRGLELRGSHERPARVRTQLRVQCVETRVQRAVSRIVVERFRQLVDTFQFDRFIFSAGTSHVHRGRTIDLCGRDLLGTVWYLLDLRGGLLVVVGPAVAVHVLAVRRRYSFERWRRSFHYVHRVLGELSKLVALVFGGRRGCEGRFNFLSGFGRDELRFRVALIGFTFYGVFGVFDAARNVFGGFLVF